MNNDEIDVTEFVKLTPEQEKLYRAINRKLEPGEIVSEMLNRELDPTNSYDIEKFLREKKRKSSRRLVDEIVNEAIDEQYRRALGQLSEHCEAVIKPWPEVTSEEMIAVVVEDYIEQRLPPRQDETPVHYAARLLTLVVAWRKYQQARDGAEQAWLQSDEYREMTGEEDNTQ